MKFVEIKVSDSKLRRRFESALVNFEFVSIWTRGSLSIPELTITDDFKISLEHPTIFVTPEVDYDLWKARVKLGHPFTWFSTFPKISTLKGCLQELLQVSANFESLRLSKEVDRSNRELEDMNNQMEDFVLQRTASTSEAKRDAEKQQKRIRRVVEFVQKISESDTLLEFLEILQREFKSQFSVKEIFLGRKDEIEISEKKLRLLYANRLGRPIGPFLKVRISLSSAKSTDRFLLFEHGIPESKIMEFERFLADRIQIINLAFERISLFLSLSKSSLEWESTFDALNNPIGIVDLDYQVLRSNRSFGPSRYKNKCHRIFANDDHKCEGCPLEKSISSGEFTIGQIRRRDRVFEVHSYPIRMPLDKRVTTVVNHYIDVTDDRKLHSTVIHHEKMTAVGVMAGHIAHELSNPLTGIGSLAQVLSEDADLPEKIRRDLSEIRSAAGRSQATIKNLLEFALQQEPSAFQKVPLNEVVRKTLPLLKTAMRLHTCEVRLEPTEVEILANSHLLQQVVFNLVQNSCQAMKESGSIEIETATEGAYVILRVTDSGPGIPPENQRRLFEPFFTTKPEGEGTGLGLSMSRTIVDRFGGELNLKWSSSKGTCFELRFGSAQ